MNAETEEQRREVLARLLEAWEDDDRPPMRLAELLGIDSELTDTQFVDSLGYFGATFAWDTFDEFEMMREGGASEGAIARLKESRAQKADEATANGLPVPEDLATAAGDALSRLRGSGVLDGFPRHEWPRVVFAQLMPIPGHSQLQKLRAAKESVESAP